MSHPAGCGSAFPTTPCNALIFLLDLGKSPQMVLKPSHSSCVTCFYFLSPCSVPFFSFSYFPWLDFSLTPCQQIQEQVMSWEIVPQTQRFYMKWRLCIGLGKYIYFGMWWSWDGPRIISFIVVLAAPSNLRWEGQEKNWISLASWFMENLKELYFCDLYLIVQLERRRGYTVTHSWTELGSQ